MEISNLGKKYGKQAYRPLATYFFYSCVRLRGVGRGLPLSSVDYMGRAPAPA